MSQKSKIPERITFSYIGNQIRSVVNLEKGLPFTTWAFLTKPGESARDFLFGDRKKYFGAIKFLFITVAIGVFITVKFTFTEGNFKEYIDSEQFKDSPEALEMYFLAINEVFSKYFNAILISAVPVTSLFTFLFFKKVKWHYAEHFAIYSYIYGITCLFSIVTAFFPMTQILWSQVVYMLMLLGYTLFAFKQIYEEKWWPTIWKTMLISTISYTILMIVMFIVMVVATVILVVANQ